LEYWKNGDRRLGNGKLVLNSLLFFIIHETIRQSINKAIFHAFPYLRALCD